LDGRVSKEISTMKANWQILGSAALAAALLLGGCAKKEDAKMAEMQKQLDEANKKLAEAQAAEGGTDGGKATAAAEGSGASGGQAGSGKAAGASSALAKQVDANKSAIGQNKAAIEQNKQAIANNKDAIATNKGAIEENKKGIAANKEAAAKAQATADEAKKAAIRPVHTLPAGYAIKVRTSSEISTKRASTGSQWEGTLEDDMEIDGYIVAPKGSTVEGTVSNADPGGRVKGVASIDIKLTRVLTPEGRAIPIRTAAQTATAKSSAKKDALKTGIASGIGAAIGAIAGGGKGAAIGAGAGAAGGIGMTMATRGDSASFPAESLLTFSLSSPVTVEERKQR
jgi:hypothetical protein